MERVVVTGGSGFVGSYVTKALLEQGHQVVVLDREPDTTLIEALTGAKDRSRLEVQDLDVRDRGAVTKEIEGASRVVHLASLLQQRSDGDPQLAVEVNCLGAVNVFDAARRAGISRVAWASSTAVYGWGTPDTSVANDAPHTASDIYGRTKSLTEAIGAHYNRQLAMETVGLRFTVVYGFGRATAIPRGSAGGPVVDLVERPVTGLKGTRVRHADTVVDWLHVEDAARAVCLALRSDGIKSPALSVTGQLATLREAAELVRELVPGADIDIEPGVSPRPMVMDLDKDAARREIGYEPAYDLRAGVVQYIDALRSARIPAKEPRR
ncbi:NAD-dependent epimerase/dehydratase family protein [Streptomyces sp. NPDC056390]|uniref:NAD-dependent epimerase/dehydratase family protein n=1 Tax=Streptomyces sp. NPDC056390 TaxID=3345806 RepID=UPI0035D883BD